MAEPCIVLLAGEGASTRIVYHAMRARFGDQARLEVIIEEPVSRKHLLKRRVKRLGLLPVVGHVLFMATVPPVLRARGRTRVEAIKAEYGLNDAPIPEPVLRVPSANAEHVRERLRTLSPSVVVVNGTRILSAETLAATRAPFINMHAGITPAYRGVHGGYWALAEGRIDRVGTTVHLIDEGIDTGGIVEQITFTPTDADTFGTYPYLHTATGCPALLRAVEAAISGELETRPAAQEMESRLRYHPTLWGYLNVGILRGVW